MVPAASATPPCLAPGELNLLAPARVLSARPEFGVSRAGSLDTGGTPTDGSWALASCAPLGAVSIQTAALSSVHESNTFPAELCANGVFSDFCHSAWNDDAGTTDPWLRLDLGTSGA